MPEELSAQDIERDLLRAMRFLSTLSRRPAIRRILVDGAGYSKDDHQRGWEMTLKLSGYRPEDDLQSAEAEATAASSAIAELDAWDGPNFARAEAALRHQFPSVADFLFSDLADQSGAASIGSVSTFLQRIDILRSGSDPARKELAELDKRAVEYLARRKILDEQIEARLRQLLELTQEFAALPPPPEEGTMDPFEEQLIARSLHRWLEDWVTQARVVIKRRDYLEKLGLLRPLREGERDGFIDGVE